MIAGRNADNLVQFALFIGKSAEEDVESAVIEDDDKLVGVDTLLHGFKPAYVVDFALLPHLLQVVVLHDRALLY